jgi:hypothetical protein
VTRKALFDAIRPFAPEGRFNAAHVLAIDSLADAFGLPAGEVAAPAVTGPPEASEIPDDYWPMLSKIESNDRPYVKASSSSASGLYQFIKATWLGEGGRWGNNPALAFGGLKPPVEEQLARAKTFTAKNVGVLKARGIPINKASLYAAHFFGPTMAAKVIGADVNARADLIAGPGPTNANPSILKGKTVGEFLSWLYRKTGDWAR